MIINIFNRKIKQHVICLMLFVFLFINTGFTQSPNWSVKINDFQYTMTFVGFLNIDGRMLSNTNDKLAAFVNGECRGVTNLIYVANQNRYYAYLTIFSNNENEMVNFKIYDSEKNSIKDIAKTIPFNASAHYGNLFQAYSFANPALSASAEILDFSFKDIIRKNIIIDSFKVGIYLDKQLIDVSALNAVFTLSAGANAFIESIPQVSGSNKTNFTNSVIYQVRSADESVIKEWSVTIHPAITYYKKNVVCYAKGEIKVEYPRESEIVVLELNGQFLVSQPITKGQTIFTNLSAGTYKVKLAGVTKEIILAQQ